MSLALDQWIFQFEKRDLVRMQVFVRIHGSGQPVVWTQFFWRLDDLKTSCQDLDSSTVLVAREICCESSSYGVACQSLRQVPIMDVILDRKVRFSPAQRGRSASLKVESDQLLSTVPFRLQAWCKVNFDPNGAFSASMLSTRSRPEPVKVQFVPSEVRRDRAWQASNTVRHVRWCRG